jgi:UDP-glucuronate 4-epimerase
MRVLVTGGAGFIGVHLCSALIDRGDKVRVLDSLTNNYDPAYKLDNLAYLTSKGRIDFIKGDIRDERALNAALKDAEVVIHLAGLAGVRESMQHAKPYWDVNVRGTAALLARSARTEVRGVVFASSSSVYGNGALPFSEDAILLPISPYGESKRTAEALVSAFGWSQKRGAVSCRLFSVYGPRQRPDLALRKFATAILRKEEITVFGDCTRDYTHVSDTVDGLIRAADLAAEGGRGVYNIGRGRSVSTLELIALLERCVGRTARVKKTPMQEGDAKHTLACIEKAKKELGYCPRTEIEEGVASFVRWLTGR